MMGSGKWLTPRGPMHGTYNAKNRTVAGPLRGQDIPVGAVMPAAHKPALEGGPVPGGPGPAKLPKSARKPVDPEGGFDAYGPVHMRPW